MAIIVDLSGGGDTGLLPCIDGVLHDPNELAVPKRKFVPDPNGTHPDLQPKTGKLFTDLASWNLAFPCQTKNPGRSVQAAKDPDSDLEIPGFKQKGGAGMKPRNSQFGGTPEFDCLPPRPLQRWTKLPHFHTSIDEQCRMGVVEGAPKADLTLRLANAKTDVEMQNRLAAVDLGFRGLMYGSLINRYDNSPVVDFDGKEVGVAFIEWDPAFEVLMSHVAYVVVQGSNAQDLKIHGLGIEKRFGDELTYDMCVQEFLRMSSKVGEQRRLGVLRAKILQHSGDYGNFLLNPSTDLLKTTDMDSTVDAMTVPDELRGPQLIRDLGNDLRRMISLFSYFSYSEKFCQDIENGDIQPFKAFLGSVFKGQVAASEINRWSDWLQDQYKTFLNSAVKSHLDSHAAGLRKLVTTGASEHGEKYYRDIWQYFHDPFLAPSMECLYLLVRSAESNAELTSQGYTLPSIARETVQQQFRAGAKEFHDKRTQAGKR